MANRYGENGINDVATPVYTNIFKLSSDSVGLVLGLIRLWDAITDPSWAGCPITGKANRGAANPSSSSALS